MCKDKPEVTTSYPTEAIYGQIFDWVAVEETPGEITNRAIFEPRNTPTGKALLDLFSAALERCVDKLAYLEIDDETEETTTISPNEEPIVSNDKELPAYVVYDPLTVIAAIHNYQSATPGLYGPFERIEESEDGNKAKEFYRDSEGRMISKSDVLGQMAKELARGPQNADHLPSNVLE